MHQCNNKTLTQMCFFGKATCIVDKVKPQKKLIDLEQNFEAFIGTCTESDGYFDPLRFHLEKRNAVTLKKYFDDGGSINDITTLGTRHILQDTSNLKIMEVLLENGAEPNGFFMYSEHLTPQHMELLIKHGFDLREQLKMQEGLAKNELFMSYLEKLEG